MIKFGTSGWRAVMGDEFTFQNVRTVVQAICNYLKSEGKTRRGVLVGYDTRFLSDRFAREAAKVISHNRIVCYLSDRDSPTPAISYEIIRRDLDAAINFTASHNPAEYNGLKMSTEDGGPAVPEVTQRIEQHILRIENERAAASYYPEESLIHEVDLSEYYLKLLASKIDFEKISRSGMLIAIDALYGTARDYLDRILIQNGCACEVIHNFKDPYFGGYSPACSESNLVELRATVQQRGCRIALATDGDADRFAVLDRNGDFVPANYLLALLFRYLVQTRPHLMGGVARSIATTHLLDRLAAKYSVPLYETPVGFKYISGLLLEGKLIMGGEESGGFTMGRHLPEKDGILACLLVAEMAASSSQSLGEMIRELFAEVGPLYNRRLSIKLTAALSERLAEQLERMPGELGGRRAVSVSHLDGVRLAFEDGSWLLMRLAGTEPLMRMYAEAPTPAGLDELIEAGRHYVYQFQ
ncbi:MAG: phosphoglucomutase/phosphomannomutase family protein [Acidobacteriota bacterium]